MVNHFGGELHTILTALTTLKSLTVNFTLKNELHCVVSIFSIHSKPKLNPSLANGDIDS